MADTTITSANSVYTITVASLYPSPVTLQGYEADKAFTTEAIDLAEVNMGVDGRMTAGYTPMPTTQTVTLQADSPSIIIFETLIQATKTAREIFYISGSIALPSTGRVYAMTRGVLTNVKQIPDAQKVLKGMDFVITWQSVNVAPL